MSNVHVYVEFVLRWIHFIAGVIWIGHLYFFNFVNSVFAKTLDAETKRKVMPELMPRALFWFRWGAMFTFLSGYGIIIWKMFVVSNAGLMGEGGLFTSSWGQWIIAMISHFGWPNRWNDSMGTQLEPAPLKFAEAHLADDKWEVGIHRG